MMFFRKKPSEHDRMVKRARHISSTFATDALVQTIISGKDERHDMKLVFMERCDDGELRPKTSVYVSLESAMGIQRALQRAIERVEEDGTE